jgi:hypothetical protein
MTVKGALCAPFRPIWVDFSALNQRAKILSRQLIWLHAPQYSQNVVTTRDRDRSRSVSPSQRQLAEIQGVGQHQQINSWAEIDNGVSCPIRCQKEAIAAIPPNQSIVAKTTKQQVIATGAKEQIITAASS